jgi:hypothetical protein
VHLGTLGIRGGSADWDLFVLDLAKPFPYPDEAILKQNGAYPSSSVRTGDYYAIHPRSALGPFAQQLPGRLAAGATLMTLVIAFLVCCSAAVFLAHAVDAYQAG